MRNNKFVDKIVVDKTDQEFEVMMPDSRLEEYISHTMELRKLSYRNRFFKSFFENVDSEFPYQDLSLQQIGIPFYDVVQVTTERGLYYVELSADKDLYM